MIGNGSKELERDASLDPLCRPCRPPSLLALPGDLLLVVFGLRSPPPATPAVHHGRPWQANTEQAGGVAGHGRPGKKEAIICWMELVGMEAIVTKTFLNDIMIFVKSQIIFLRKTDAGRVEPK